MANVQVVRQRKGATGRASVAPAAAQTGPRPRAPVVRQAVRAQHQLPPQADALAGEEAGVAVEFGVVR